jgi:hypothetical protein
MESRRSKLRWKIENLTDCSYLFYRKNGLTRGLVTILPRYIRTTWPPPCILHSLISFFPVCRSHSPSILLSSLRKHKLSTFSPFQPPSTCSSQCLSSHSLDIPAPSLLLLHTHLLRRLLSLSLQPSLLVLAVTEMILMTRMMRKKGSRKFFERKCRFTCLVDLTNILTLPLKAS